MACWRVAGLAAGILACTEFTGDLDRVVAIELMGSATPRVEEGDSLQLEARVLRANGEEVPDAEIIWTVVDVDSGQVGFTLDSLTGLIIANAPGSGRVQARFDELATQPITVTSTAAPDSLATAGETRLVFDTTAAEASPPLETLVLDLTSSPGDELPLSGKFVDYALVAPSPGSDSALGILLTPSDEVEPATDPHLITVVTGADGRAAVVVRHVSGAAAPDSVHVDASAFTATNQVVAGSPIRFTVILQ